jgi:queuine tRNA-ribosyltransferase
VQGGLDYRLRDICLNALSKKDANGFAIGGLSGGEAKIDFVRVIRLFILLVFFVIF